MTALDWHFPLSSLFHLCVCVCVACTDTELHSLAARLKDWFGVLHLDANRDLKSSDSFDSTTGREYIPRPHHMHVCECVCRLFLPNSRPFSVLMSAGGDVDPPLFSVMSTRLNTSQLCQPHTHSHSNLSVLLEKDKNVSDLDMYCSFKKKCTSVIFFLYFCCCFVSFSPLDFDTSILPICKDSLGWMFNKLDMNFDLLLDQSELSAIYLDKYELCMKPLFNSCDSFKDGKLSNNEWCYCFQKPEGEGG